MNIDCTLFLGQYKISRVAARGQQLMYLLESRKNNASGALLISLSFGRKYFADQTAAEYLTETLQNDFDTPA